MVKNFLTSLLIAFVAVLAAGSCAPVDGARKEPRSYDARTSLTVFEDSVRGVTCYSGYNSRFACVKTR